MSDADSVGATGTTTPAPEPIGTRAPSDTPRSLGRDALDDLRRNPLVIVALVIIAVLVLMAVAPGLFTSKGPRECVLSLSRNGPSSSAWFGNDNNGCDVYARTIHGARASILVGVISASIVAAIGALVGMLAGFFGGIVDTLISRATDIFFGIPFLLGGIIVLTSFPASETGSFWGPVFKVVFVLAFLGWTVIARLMRSSVLQVRAQDYVAAARSLGASTPRILRVHVLPNAVQPVIVYATILLGVFIGVEAALSYLGVGLQPPVVSWGVAISDGQRVIRQSPHMLFFPSIFLSVTVLAFIMLGDAVRDALDPKQR